METTQRIFHEITILGQDRINNNTVPFKSARQAFQYCVDNKLCDPSNFGITQANTLARLHLTGIIKYKKELRDVVKPTPVVKTAFKMTPEIKNFITDEVNKQVQYNKPRELVVKQPHKHECINVGIVHKSFNKIIQALAAKRNVLMVGPAGSFKTSTAHKAAEALGIKYYSLSVGIQTSKTEFMGYMDATGNYVRTLFREAYEKGGVFLIDEIDAGNPGVLTVINGALANGVCAFPDAMVTKHPDFICMAAANTWGKGADRQYVGRNQLDAATLNRFVKLFIDYDEDMESALATNQEWFTIVRRIRATAFSKKLRVLVTPRATFDGCALIEQGINFWDALEMTILNGCSEEEVDTILQGTVISKSTLQNTVIQ